MSRGLNCNHRNTSAKVFGVNLGRCALSCLSPQCLRALGRVLGIRCPQGCSTVWPRGSWVGAKDRARWGVGHGWGDYSNRNWEEPLALSQSLNRVWVPPGLEVRGIAVWAHGWGGGSFANSSCLLRVPSYGVPCPCKETASRGPCPAQGPRAGQQHPVHPSGLGRPGCGPRADSCIPRGNPGEVSRRAVATALRGSGGLEGQVAGGLRRPPALSAPQTRAECSPGSGQGVRQRGQPDRVPGRS